MKHIVLSTLAFFLSFPLFSQSEHKRTNLRLDDLYRHSMEVYCDSMQGDISGVLFVEYSPTTADDLPAVIGSIALDVLTSEELHKLTSNRKSVSLMRIFPIQQIDGSFVVTMASYIVSRKGKKFEFALQLGIGAKVKYRYDCNVGCFVFSEIIW